jgi:hypothetical protein
MIPQFIQQDPATAKALDSHYRYTVTDLDEGTRYWTEVYQHALNAANSVMLARIVDNDTGEDIP